MQAVLSIENIVEGREVTGVRLQREDGQAREFSVLCRSELELLLLVRTSVTQARDIYIRNQAPYLMLTDRPPTLPENSTVFVHVFCPHCEKYMPCDTCAYTVPEVLKKAQQYGRRLGEDKQGRHA